MISRTFAMPLVLASAAVSISASAQEVGDPVPNLFICSVLKGPVSLAYEAQQAVNRTGGRIVYTYDNIFNGFAIRVAPQAVPAIMEHNPNVIGCEQSEYVGLEVEAASTATRGPGSGGGGGGGGKPGGGGGGGDGGGQITDWGVTRVGGPATMPANGWGRKVFVVDTGVDLDHPDLNVDDANSVDFTGSRKGADDENGHGSHVAGIIGALNNSIGTVGVAPGVQIVSIRVLDRRAVGPDADVLAGLNHIAGGGSGATPGDVINLSLVADTDILDTAVADLGTKGYFVVMGAGNSATDAATVSPARVNGTNLFTISAFKLGDDYSYPSNSGSPIDFAEPGEDIQSLDKNGGYTTKSGTSMAAPHASGIIVVLGDAPLADGDTKPGSGLLGDPDGSGDPIGVWQVP